MKTYCKKTTLICFVLVLVFGFLWIQHVFPQSGTFDKTIKTTWNANKEPDLQGYIIYYGPESKSYSYSIDVGMDTTKTINYFSNVDFFAAVTAYDSSGNESAYSNEIFDIYADINCDSAVNIIDWEILKYLQGRSLGDPLYDPKADLNKDTDINIIDWLLMKYELGRY